MIIRGCTVADGLAGAGYPTFPIVMELLPSSLDAVIARRAACTPARPFGSGRLRAIASQLADALCYLHDGLSPPLLHRDIKPANVFLPAAALAADAPRDGDEDDNGGEDLHGGLGRLRLGDFDVGVRAASGLVDFVGTPSISTPPEMWRQEAHHTPADVWAYGMTLQCCMLLGDPLEHATMSELEERLTATPTPTLPIFDMAEGAQQAAFGALAPMAELARRCCFNAPAERLKASELHDHLPSSA